MNWIIDVLLVVIFGFLLAALCFEFWRQDAVKDGYFIAGHKLYKVTEVKDER